MKAARGAGCSPITWGNGNGGYPLDRMTGLVRWWVAPKATLDVDAAMEAAAGHTYPNSTTTRGFDTLEDARALVARFRYEAVPCS